MGRNQRTGIMLPAPYDPPTVRRWLVEHGHVVAQPKLAGAHVRWTGQSLLSSQGNPVTGLPHLAQELAERLPGIAVEGEAYCHGWPDARVSGIMRRRPDNLHPQHERIELVIFDLIAPDISLHERLKRLDWLPEGLSFRVIPSSAPTSPAAVEELLVEFVAQGFEGIVIKHPKRKWVEGRAVDRALKWKPGRSDTYHLVECLPGAGKFSGTLGAMLLTDAEGHQFKVGSFAIDGRYRDAIWAVRDKLAGEQVRIFYNTPDKAARAAGVFQAMASPSAQFRLKQYCS